MFRLSIHFSVTIDLVTDTREIKSVINKLENITFK